MQLYGMALLRSKRGSCAKVARVLGVTRAAVIRWNRIPAERVVSVERATGVPRYFLRPDLYAVCACQTVDQPKLWLTPAAQEECSLMLPPCECGAVAICLGQEGSYCLACAQRRGWLTRTPENDQRGEPPARQRARGNARRAPRHPDQPSLTPAL